MAFGIAEALHAGFQQRRALVDAEQFLAQHAVGRVGLLQALRLRPLVDAQRVDAGVERLPLLRDVRGAAPARGRASASSPARPARR